MALGILTITFPDGRNKTDQTVSGRTKFLQGNIVLSANSSFNTSIIERYFDRCNYIDVQLGATASGYFTQWRRSATHKAGVLKMFTVSVISAVNDPLAQSPGPASLNGCFYAVGW